jgi:hypothetical protein
MVKRREAAHRRGDAPIEVFYYPKPSPINIL